MTNPETVAESYLAVWNDQDGARRRERLAQAWRDDARYVDPIMQAKGAGGIADMIEGARAQFPGLGFSLAGPPGRTRRLRPLLLAARARRRRACRGRH